MWFTIVLTFALFVFLWFINTLSTKRNNDHSLTYRHGLWRRPLGKCMETNFLKTMPHGYGTISSALYFVSKFKLSADVMLTALDRLAREHPLLQARCTRDEGGRLYLEQMPYFQVLFDESDHEDWTQLMSEEVTHKFDTEQGPLWKVTRLPNHPPEPDFRDPDFPFQDVIVISMNHALVDGTSFISIMMKDFIRILGGLSRGDIQTADPVESKEVPWPPETILPELKGGNSPWWLALIQLVFSRHILINLSQLRGSPTNNDTWVKKLAREKRRNLPRKFGMIPVTFSRDVTAKFVKACKRHGVTVQAAAQTMSSVILATILQGGTLREDMQIKSRISVSLAPLFPDLLRNPSLVCKYSSVSSVLTAQPTWRETFWLSAKEAKQKLHCKLADNAVSFLRVLRLKLPLFDLGLMTFKDEQQGRVNLPLDFTNLGDCSHVNTDKSVRLRASYSGTYLVNASPLIFSHLVTFDGRLAWTVSYATGLLSDHMGREFARRLYDVIDHVTK